MYTHTNCIQSEYTKRCPGFNVYFMTYVCFLDLPKLNRGDSDELVDNHCSSPGHQNAFVKKEAEKRLEEQEALKTLVKVPF